MTDNGHSPRLKCRLNGPHPPRFDADSLFLCKIDPQQPRRGKRWPQLQPAVLHETAVRGTWLPRCLQVPASTGPPKSVYIAVFTPGDRCQWSKRNLAVGILGQRALCVAGKDGVGGFHVIDRLWPLRFASLASDALALQIFLVAFDELIQTIH